MKLRILILAAALLAAWPVAAQNIPAGDDKWDTTGGGTTNVTLASADWAALCGAGAANSTVNLKGFNLSGQGTADTIITRLAPANFSAGATQTVPIKLKNLSMVSEGSHPCSPNTLRVTGPSTSVFLPTGTMTITRTGSAGGTFTADVKVTADIVAVNGAGTPVGATITVGGSLVDTATNQWSYTPPTGGTAGAPWYPSVDPVTHAPAKTCRRGNKTLPAFHCYQPPPRCGRAAAKAIAQQPVYTLQPGGDDDATISLVEHCVEAVPVDQVQPAEPIGVIVVGGTVVDN